MRIDEVALLMGAGAITKACIAPAVMKAGKWIIHVERKGGEVIVLTAQRNNVRHFASIDSAWKVLDELGFRTASIDWQ